MIKEIPKRSDFHHPNPTSLTFQSRPPQLEHFLHAGLDMLWRIGINFKQLICETVTCILVLNHVYSYRSNGEGNWDR